jgi:serine/threonine protein kinase/WD40 repeat protein
MGLQPGTKLGNYEIVALLGAGGMGEVYRARDLSLQREVAVKILSASYSQDADRLRRFMQEAQATAALNHPNILSVHQIGQEDGAPYIVSELLEGQSLRDAMRGGALPVRKAVEYGAQIARGLAAAHGKGIVHRDLKPENIFVTRDGRAKILDFGLAKLVQPERESSNEGETVALQTEAGIVMGTSGYMSPEQARGEIVDHRSDIFAFGAILYEMLSGRKAFGGKSGAEAMVAILREDPGPIEGNRNISPAVERILQHCLEKEPGSRFQSAGDLAFDLESLSGSTTASAAGKEIARRGKRVGIWIAAGAVVAVVMTAVGISLHDSRPAQLQWHRLTFQKGTVQAARFATDGRSVVYSAAWKGNPSEIFTTRTESPESRSLGLKNVRLLSVSPRGELALLTNALTVDLGVSSGTLARMPLDGGSPREVVQNAQFAEWTPDGAAQAIVHDVDGRSVLEFPEGHRVFDGAAYLASPRISPSGKRIAFFEYTARIGDSGSVEVIDAGGTRRILSEKWTDLTGLAWSPDGKEVWVTGTRDSGTVRLYGISLDGKLREILRVPSDLVLMDIASDGRVLLGAESWLAEINVRGEDASQDRDLSLFDFSIPGALSRDGKWLLFTEGGEAGGPLQTTYLGKTDGSAPTKLFEGACNSLSPDNKVAVCGFTVQPGPLTLVPTGAGKAKTLADDHLFHVLNVGWFPDGQALTYAAFEPGHTQRVYLDTLDGQTPRAVTPEGVCSALLSPDGKKVAAAMTSGKLFVYPVGGGEPQIVPNSNGQEWVVGWGRDGKSLFVLESRALPASVLRLDLETGKRQLWKTITPAETSGADYILPLLITTDEKSYVYGLNRRLTNLYVVEGLK